MKLSVRFAIFIAFSLLVTLTSCIKEPKQVVAATKYELPAITYTGKHTAGLKFQDEVLILDPIYVPSIEHSKDIIHYVFTHGNEEIGYDQVFHIENFHGVGSYKIPDDCSMNVRWLKSKVNWEQIHLSGTIDAQYYSGYLNIFYIDTVKHITAGIYEYTIVDSTFQNGDTVRIRDGRFDFKY